MPQDCDDLILWVGTTHDEITSATQLQQQISEYCSISDDISLRLEADSREYFEPDPSESSFEIFFTAKGIEERIHASIKRKIDANIKRKKIEKISLKYKNLI